MTLVRVPLKRKPNAMFHMLLGAMCLADKPSDIVRTLLADVSDGVLPELNKAKGMTQNSHHVHDVFDHTMEVLDATPKGVNVRVAALLHDLGTILIYLS